MILRTTNVRVGRMIHAMPNDFDMVLALLEELAHLTGGDKPRSRVEIELCHAAGIALRDCMMERCYTDREMMRRGLSSSEHGALQDLVTATNEEARHPAMRDIGVTGHDPRVFHAWRAGPGLWSPFPHSMPGRFQVLRPVWHVNPQFPSEKFTLWEPDTQGLVPASRFNDEAFHLQFLSPPA